MLSAEYKGTYHFEDHQSFQGEKFDAIETLKWDELGTQTVRGDTGAVLSSTFTLVVSGKLYLNSTNGGKPIIEEPDRKTVTCASACEYTPQASDRCQPNDLLEPCKQNRGG